MKNKFVIDEDLNNFLCTTLPDSVSRSVVLFTQSQKGGVQGSSHSS